MKKPRSRREWGFFLLLTLASASCKAPAPTPASTKEALEGLTRRTLAALDKKDMTALAALAHPSKGITFSPYAFVGTGDVVFKSDRLAGMLVETKKYVWGSYDGSGEPIEMTPAEYWKRFVYDVPFKDGTPTYDDREEHSGNTAVNHAEVFPDAIAVSVRYEPPPSDNGGIDWRKLYLLFEKAGSQWYLRAIVHSEWTI